MVNYDGLCGEILKKISTDRQTDLLTDGDRLTPLRACVHGVLHILKDGMRSQELIHYNQMVK